MTDLSMEYWIGKLQLQPHPEGGYFKRIYTAEEEIPKVDSFEKFCGTRKLASSIHYLLPSDDFSAFHQLKQNEIWCFHYGSSLNLHLINEEGSYSTITIGLDIEKGEQPLYVVKAGNWFCGEVNKKNTFSLVSCILTPSFDFSDFTFGQKNILIKKFPKHENIIKKFTKQ